MSSSCRLVKSFDLNGKGELIMGIELHIRKFQDFGCRNFQEFHLMCVSVGISIGAK